ncbi:MAG TPA: rhodanese-like domain-containing protein [Woeseiaceae bacterium]|nr:rhodanese-like domain-containing protein [Woeseiaceae bacterium]
MYEELTPAELVARCRAGELWQLLDVREPWEVAIASIEETDQMPTKHIPMSEIPVRHTELEESEPVAVLCHSGARSARVAGFLAQQGYSRVANVSGGIDAWSSEVNSSIPRY